MKKRGKLFAIVAFAMLLALSFALAACHDTSEPQPQPTEKILELSRSSVELDMYESVLLTVETAGEGAVEWRSSNNAIATVENGLVKAVAAGKATVTATRGEYSGTCSVTVVNSMAAPLIVLSVSSIVKDKGETVAVDASVAYKGNAVSDHAQFTWSYAENADETVATFTADGAHAQIALNEYGESAIDVSTVVWGIPVTRRIDIRVCNTSVTFSSELDEAQDGYLLTLDTVAADGYNTVAADAKLTVTDNGAPVDTSKIAWTSSDASVATALGNTVMSGGRIGTAVLTGSYNNNFVRIFVTCESVNVTLTDVWTLELKDQKTVDYKFSDVLGGGKMRGAPQAVEIPYTELGADVAIKRDIFRAYDSETDTITMAPPTRAANMGKIGNVTVTTDAAVYTLPMEIYTMIISDADDLDEIGRYTKHQWADKYLWDGYFILDNDIKYNAKENLAGANGACALNANTRLFKPFVYADNGENTGTGGLQARKAYFDPEKQISMATYDKGFIGVFDGRGHVIDGLMVDASPNEKDKQHGEAYYGGFIGALGSLKKSGTSLPDPRCRGTIKNVSFTNVVHGVHNVNGKEVGTAGGFLLSASVNGIIENVYIDVIDLHGSNGLFSPAALVVQSLKADNFVVNIKPERDLIGWGNSALGNVCSWQVDDTVHLKNLYVMRKLTAGNGGANSAIGFSGGGANGYSDTIAAPVKAFASAEELAAYLEENGLTVSAENGWDPDFWATDEFGAPIPVALTHIVLNKNSLTLDMHDSFALSAKTSSEGGTVSFESSNTAVAAVTQTGVVTSVADGTAVITATWTTATGETYTAFCKVTVVDTHTLPVITVERSLNIAELSKSAQIPASLTYKGNPIADEIVWSWRMSGTSDAIELTSNDSVATVTSKNYGSATLTVSATVWGQTISETVSVFVGNPNITVESALDKRGDVYVLELNMFDGSGNVSTADARITVKNGGETVTDLTHLIWRGGTEGDVTVVTAAGNTITAVSGGTATLRASYQGKFIDIEVTVKREQKDLTAQWNLELKGNKEITVNVSDISAEIKGTVQSVVIDKYNFYNGDTFDKTGEKDILKSVSGSTITLAPPYRYREGMGEMQATITTTQGIYTLPIGIYTMIIDNAADLDEFGKYTAHQWDDAYLWDGYFILDADITYNSLENLTNVSSATKFFTPFIYSDHGGGYPYFGAEQNDNTKTEGYKRGFVGMFDGRGHVIDGLVVDGSVNEKNTQKDKAYHGGFIGMLGSLQRGSIAQECGTIQNISFTNVIHGQYTVNGETKGTIGGFLFSLSVQGIVKNIYIDVLDLASNSNGLLSPAGSQTVQTLTAENFVVNIRKDNIDWGEPVLGPIKYWGDCDYLRNVYVVNVKTNAKAMDLSGSAGENKTNSPDTVFGTQQALAAYLSENNLTVSADNGWDMSFWTVDAFGAPIPKHGGAVTLAAGDTFTLDITDSASAAYTSSDPNVVSVSTNGVLTALATGTATVTATWDGKTAQCFVTVILKEVELSGKWTIELSSYFAVSNGKKTPSKQLSLSAADLNAALSLSGDDAIVSCDSVVSIKLGKGSNVKEILKSKDANSVVIEPPYRHSDGMGDGMTATIVTTGKIYSIDCAVYTMIIDNADELDEFGEYTKYQWDETYRWDGYFVLGSDIVYNTAENLADKEGNCKVNSNTRMFKPFICNYYRDGNNVYFDAEHKQAMAAFGVGFMGMFDGRGHVIDGLMIDNSENENDASKTNAYFGGFIGMLGTLQNATTDYSKRGTIRNISFTNIVHGIFDGKGTAGGFLFSANIYGVTENVYMHVLYIAANSNGLLSPAANTVQTVKMHNVVVDIEANGDKINYSWGNNALGVVASWDAPNEHRYLKNVYTVRPKRDKNTSIAGAGSQNYTGISAPTQAFENTAALATYLSENDLTVSAEHGWDMTFWTTDESGAPIPVTVKAAA